MLRRRPLPGRLIDAKMMRSHVLATLAIKGKRLTVAISNPDHLQTLHSSRLQTQLKIASVIAEHNALLALIDRLAETTNDAPVLRFLQDILDDAVSKGTSDLHFEAYEKSCPFVSASTAYCMKSRSHR